MTEIGRQWLFSFIFFQQNPLICHVTTQKTLAHDPPVNKQTSEKKARIVKSGVILNMFLWKYVKRFPHFCNV